MEINHILSKKPSRKALELSPDPESQEIYNLLKQFGDQSIWCDIRDELILQVGKLLIKKENEIKQKKLVDCTIVLNRSVLHSKSLSERLTRLCPNDACVVRD